MTNMQCSLVTRCERWWAAAVPWKRSMRHSPLPRCLRLGDFFALQCYHLKITPREGSATILKAPIGAVCVTTDHSPLQKSRIWSIFPLSSMQVSCNPWAGKRLLFASVDVLRWVGPSRAWVPLSSEFRKWLVHQPFLTTPTQHCQVLKSFVSQNTTLIFFSKLF